MESINIVYEFKGNIVRESFLNLNGSNSHFTIETKTKDNKTVSTLNLKKGIIIKLLSVYIKKDEIYSNDTQVFCNGYSSYSFSSIYNKYEKQDKLGLIANFLTKKTGLKYYSDYYFYDKKIKKGIFRSYSYSYINKNGVYKLYGSNNENFAYTIFRHNMRNNSLEIYKDVVGRVIKSTTVLFDFSILEGSYSVLNDYFKSISKKKIRKAPKLKGYTSGSYNFRNINEESLMYPLLSLDEGNLFQIDDGYESFVGDWLNISKEKFPNSFYPLLKTAKTKGVLTGIWLAPFICEKNSLIFKNHPDFILKNEKNKPFYLGDNWSGFYALDILNLEVQAYLEKVFSYFINLGFDFFKVDYLYAASVLPRNNFTRSELMNFATNLIKKWSKDKLILGCDLPLSSAYNKFDYCKISSDITLTLSRNFITKLILKFSGLSSNSSLVNTILRNPLDNNVFINYAGLYMLNKENNKLDKSKRVALAKINRMFSGLNLTSDDLSKLKEEMKEFNKSLDNLSNVSIIDIKKYVSTYKIKLKDGLDIFEIDYNYLGGYLLD